MTGRGFTLKDFKKKEEKDDSQSVAASSLHLFVGRGTGRGMVLPPVLRPAESCAASSIGMGRGVIIGRGMASVKPATQVAPQSLTSSGSKDPVTSGDHSTPKKDSSAASGIIISGRGFGTSGRGSGGSMGRGSSNKDASYLPQSMEEELQPKSDEAQKSFEARSQAQSVEVQVEASNAIASAPTQPIPQQQRALTPPTEDPPQFKQKLNLKSKEIGAMVNLMEIHCGPSSGIFEYYVEFSPPVDNMNFRAKYLSQHREFIGNAKTFDGVILFLPRRLPDEITRLMSTNIVDQSPVEVKITFKRQKRREECVQLYNILFERIFRILNYLRVGRKNFDPTAPQLIPQHKLEIWPGYVKSVDLHENDRLLLTLDVSHRVLSTRSVYDVMKEAHKSDGDRFKDNIKKTLIGSIVLTRYNNKTYRIDDILFDQTPQSTFKQGDADVSYVEYYKKQYNLAIQDEKQYLLISRMEVRVSGEKEKREYVVSLVPELCSMTGLSDAQKSNFTIMKDVAAHTKLAPLARVNSFKKFLSNVNNNKDAKEVLADWGLTLDNDPLKITARLLNEETILFGRGKEGPAGPQADFSRHTTTNQVLEPIDLIDWLLVYFVKDKKQGEAFEETLLKVCGSTGMRVSQPRRIELPNDRTETYITAIRKELADPKIQMVVCIFPSLRDDRYAAVKKIMCVEIPVPSQCINSKTLRNEAKNRSIVLKILLQMNCKMGGTLWGIKIPLKDTMICGIDTYHEVGHKGITVGGFVASFNSQFTRWFSRPTIQEKREELVNGLTISMEEALRTYKKFNGQHPERIILYRDGVGDGQLDFVRQFEIPQFKAAFKRIDKDYNPKLTFVVVQKRINVKFFLQSAKGLANPPPGSVLDHTVTSRDLYDFFLVSQVSFSFSSLQLHFHAFMFGSMFVKEPQHRRTTSSSKMVPTLSQTFCSESLTSSATCTTTGLEQFEFQLRVSTLTSSLTWLASASSVRSQKNSRRSSTSCKFEIGVTKNILKTKLIC